MIECNTHEFIPGFSAPILDETTGKRHIVYRLSESDMFNYANRKASVNGETLLEVIPKMLVPDQGFIQVSLGDFDKSVLHELFESTHYRITCKTAMRNLIDSNKVVLVYSDKYKIPTSIPYVVQSSGPSARVYVNISDFVSMDSYGKIKVDQIRNYNGLMAIIFAASAIYRIVSRSITLNAEILDGMVLMYGAMLSRTINSIIHLDPITKDKVRYLSVQFALIQMFGTEQGVNIFQRFRRTYFPKLSDIIMEAIDDQFHLDSYDSLNKFVLEIVRVYPSMRNLTLNVLFDKWVMQYGAASALAIDYMGYFLYVLSMTLFESPLVSRPALEAALENSKGALSYKALQKLIETA